MSFRHKARELALQVLFQWDIHHGTSGWLTEFWKQNAASPEAQHFAETLIEGVISHVTELDALIGRYAENWTISRMAVIDRNVLRIATYELVHLPDIPARVTLNEAIDLVKRFGDAQSGAFVNGILDRMLKDESCLRLKAHESTQGKEARPGEREPVSAASGRAGANREREPVSAGSGRAGANREKGPVPARPERAGANREKGLVPARPERAGVRESSKKVIDD
jgi:N utilization substance protein B